MSVVVHETDCPVAVNATQLRPDDSNCTVGADGKADMVSMLAPPANTPSSASNILKGIMAPCGKEEKHVKESKAKLMIIFKRIRCIYKTQQN